jgi:hypothetical protein
VTALVIVGLLVVGGVVSWIFGPDTRDPRYALHRQAPSSPHSDSLESRFP